MEARESSRQEIAERLREKYRERNAPGMFEPQDVGMQAYGYLHDIIDCLPDGESAFTVIADLIDPTCEMTVNDGHACCGKCGHRLSDECEVEEDYYEFRPYCPDCGARVISR